MKVTEFQKERKKERKKEKTLVHHKGAHAGAMHISDCAIASASPS